MSFTDPSGFGLFSGLKKLFKGIGSAIKKAFKNPVFRAIVGMAAAYLTYGALNGAFIRGGNFTAAFASGFVGGAITTGSLKGALVGGATALAFYGVGSAFPSASKLRGAAPWKKGQLWFGKIVAHGTVGGTSSAAQGGSFQDGFRSAGFTQLAAPGIVGTVPGGAVGRTAAAAVVGGTASRLGGGKFANGAQTFAFVQMFTEAASYYENAVGRKANPLPGENRAPSNYVPDPVTGRQPEGTWDQNVIGLNEPLQGSWYAPGNFFKQGGVLSRALNIVPTINATGALHDYWFNDPNGLSFTPFNNVGAMLPAAAIGVGASIGNFTQGWQSNPMALYLLTQPYDRNRR